MSAALGKATGGMPQEDADVGDGSAIITVEDPGLQEFDDSAIIEDVRRVPPCHVYYGQLEAVQMRYIAVWDNSLLCFR